MLAAGARSVAVVVIVGWVALSNPERGLAHAWVLGTALLFAVTGLAQFWLYARDLAPALAPYVFALVDSLVLAAVFVVPNPFAPVGAAPGDTAALRQLRVLLRPADADGVLVPPAPAAVVGAVRRGGVDARRSCGW